jgi:hypothetical protein
VHAWRNLYALPGIGLPGRKYARIFLQIKKKIVRADRGSQRELQSKARVAATAPILKIDSDSRFTTAQRNFPSKMTEGIVAGA